MLTYTARAVPWLRVGAALALVCGLMELVRWDPYRLWPLQGTAVGLLAGASAWCFDEQSASVVDAAPRGPAWRTTARAPAVLLLTASWVAVVAHAASSLFGHATTISLQGVVAVVAGAAWCACRRASGDGMPGTRAAAAVVPVATTWALVRPFDEQLPVFPYAAAGTHGSWEMSLLAWLLLGAVSVAVLVLAMAEFAWWRPHPLQR